MKKALAVFGAIALLFLILGAAGAAITYVRANSFNSEGKAYIESSVEAIVKSWDRKQLFERAAPELLEKINKSPEFDIFFARLSRLGSLTRMEPATGNVGWGYTTKTGEMITANYSEKIYFENGEATVRVSAVRRSGEWKLIGFFVNVDNQTNKINPA